MIVRGLVKVLKLTSFEPHACASSCIAMKEYEQGNEHFHINENKED